MDRQLIELSKTVSHALRHAPWLYELELDEEGWVEVADLLEGLRNHRRQWANVGLDDLKQIMAESDKQRFEIKDGRIRAFYGHSVPTKLRHEPAQPPTLLYHGTADRTVAIINQSGLKPMNRQYVHLSADPATAAQVAQRKGGQSVILTVRAGAAYEQGIVFYHGNEMVWLADYVPPEFIELA